MYEGGPQSFPVFTILTPGVSNAQALTGQKVNKTTDTDWGSPPHLLKQGLSLERALQLDWDLIKEHLRETWIFWWRYNILTGEMNI